MSNTNKENLLMWDDIDDESKDRLKTHIDKIMGILEKHNLTEKDYVDLIHKRYDLEIEKMYGDLADDIYECGCSCDENEYF